MKKLTKFVLGSSATGGGVVPGSPVGCVTMVQSNSFILRTMETQTTDRSRRIREQLRQIPWEGGMNAPSFSGACFCCTCCDNIGMPFGCVYYLVFVRRRASSVASSASSPCVSFSLSLLFFSSSESHEVRITFNI